MSSRIQAYYSKTCLKIPIKLSLKENDISTLALLDSGAAGDFMSHEFARQHNIPLIPCNSLLAVEVLDGRPLGDGRVLHTTVELVLVTETFHKENIHFYIITSPHNLVILGLPWLRQHNPLISWKEGQISQWDPSCQARCLNDKPAVTIQAIKLTESSEQTTTLPSEYTDLVEAFSKVKASKLPPHRANDCAIDLLPGTTPPKGRIFPLSQPESEAMRKYIDEELSKGFIRPSTSPSSAGFFFIKKKDGGLRPCIDYQGLNDITIKFRYPIPLVPVALEQLRKANYFSKLDLRNAYNLIRIKEGDEWKTPFSTCTGHYEYFVMPFSLANRVSVLHQ